MASDRKKVNISYYTGNTVSPRLLSVLQHPPEPWVVQENPLTEKHRKHFFLHDENGSGLPARADEYIAPSLVSEAKAEYDVRINPDYQVKESCIVVPVPLYQDASVGACWEHSNPFRQLLLHAATFDDLLQSSDAVQQNIPACCKEKKAWVIERTLAPLLSNASGIFPTVDLRLKENKDASSSSQLPPPLLTHYGHMMPMVNERVTQVELASKVAVFYLAFKVGNHSKVHLQKASDRLTLIWHNPSFLSVQLLPRIDIVSTNLPFLAHLTYMMGCAHADPSREFLIGLAKSTPLYQQIVPHFNRFQIHMKESWTGREKNKETVHLFPMESMLQVNTDEASEEAILFIYLSFLVITLLHAVSPQILLEVSKAINDGKEIPADLCHKFIHTCVTVWGVHIKSEPAVMHHADHSPLVVVDDAASHGRSEYHSLVQHVAGLICKWYSTLHQEKYEEFFNKFLLQAGYPDSYVRGAQSLHRFVCKVLLLIYGK
jgi:hypothetical protein